jgi:hypothetical protein
MMTTRLTPTVSNLLQVGPLRSNGALRAASPLVSDVRLRRGGGLLGERSVLWFGPPSLVWLVAIGAAPGGDPGAATSIWGHFPPLRNPFGAPTVRQPITYLTATNPGRSAPAPSLVATSAPRSETASVKPFASPPALAPVPMTGLRAPVTEGRTDRSASPDVPKRLASEGPRTAVLIASEVRRRPRELASQPAQQRKIQLNPPKSTFSAGQPARPMLGPYPSDARVVAAPRPAIRPSAPDAKAAPAASATAAQSTRQAPIEALPSSPSQLRGVRARDSAFQWPASSFRIPLKPYVPITQQRFRRSDAFGARAKQQQPMRESVPQVAPIRLPQTEARSVWGGLRAPAVLLVAPQLRAESVDGQPQAQTIQVGRSTLLRPSPVDATLLRVPRADATTATLAEAASVAGEKAQAQADSRAPLRTERPQTVGRLAPRRDAVLVTPVPGLRQLPTESVAGTPFAEVQGQAAPLAPVSAPTAKSSTVFAGIASTLRFVRRPAAQTDGSADAGSSIRGASTTASPAGAPRTSPQTTGGQGPGPSRPATAAAMTPASARPRTKQASSVNLNTPPTRPQSTSGRPPGPRRVRRFPVAKSVAYTQRPTSPLEPRSTVQAPMPQSTEQPTSSSSESGSRPRSERRIVGTYLAESGQIWLYNPVNRVASPLRGTPLLVSSGSPLASGTAGWGSSLAQPATPTTTQT